MNSNPFSISIPVSVTAVLFKMRDEIGRLRRDKRKDEACYIVLLKEIAELTLQCNKLALENSAHIKRIHELYGTLDD
jgi:hypothetical protein